MAGACAAIAFACSGLCTSSPFFNRVGHLAADAGISVHHDGDLEPLLQPAQMRAL